MPKRKDVTYLKYCEYTKNRHGIMTSCGMRVPYNKYFRYCPYCGKPIAKLFKSWEVDEK